MEIRNQVTILSFPITESKAVELIDYFQVEEQRYQGSYTSLNNESTGAFVGNHYYTFIIEKLGYGWFSYKGNLYADYYNREKAKGKPNYRNRYEFFFVKDTAVYSWLYSAISKTQRKLYRRQLIIYPH